MVALLSRSSARNLSTPARLSARWRPASCRPAMPSACRRAAAHRPLSCRMPAQSRYKPAAEHACAAKRRRQAVVVVGESHSASDILTAERRFVMRPSAERVPRCPAERPGALLAHRRSILKYARHGPTAGEAKHRGARRNGSIDIFRQQTWWRPCALAAAVIGARASEIRRDQQRNRRLDLCCRRGVVLLLK